MIEVQENDIVEVYSDNNPSPVDNMTIYSPHILNIANRIFVVGVSSEDSSSSDLQVSSITYRGNSFTRAVAVTTSSGYNRSEIWYLLNPPAPDDGSPLYIQMTGITEWFTVNWTILYNAKQQAPEATASNHSTSTSSISQSLTTLTDGAYVIDCVAWSEKNETPRPTLGSYQYPFSDNSILGDPGILVHYGTGTGGCSRKTKSNAGSTSMSWSVSSSQRVAYTLCAFAPEYFDKGLIKAYTQNGVEVICHERLVQNSNIEHKLKVRVGSRNYSLPSYTHIWGQPYTRVPIKHSRNTTIGQSEFYFRLGMDRES